MDKSYIFLKSYYQIVLKAWISRNCLVNASGGDMDGVGM